MQKNDISERLDLTPSPRVLRMLGQIDFAPWQCLAELIDNSIDAFMDQERAGVVSSQPRVQISLPTAREIDEGIGEITVEDNARGMSIAQLESAVKAGYSGNDPVDKMGLFGMGFNISTARLGRRTQVLTTTVDSAEWVRITIDFDELERSKTFQVPVERIPKSEFELEQPTHGTKIKISRLEANRITPLIWGAGKSKTKKRLGKIYGRVMSTLDISITYDGDRIRPWRHCVWGETRTVPTAEFGNVPAIIKIDATLDSRRYCTTCWLWLMPHDVECTSCGSANEIIERGRKIRGWIGIQRYFDKEHFGFDLIRNGRVIEELDKSLFKFQDSNGEEFIEYPRDAVHWGGRIVGELEIDFVRVSHQKDSFDKLDSEWRHVIEVIRGESPIQPKIAERMRLPVNSSPLARLFSGYRKGKAGLRDLVPATKDGNGLNTGAVIEYRDKFYDGHPDYQDDSRTYALVLLAERANRGESNGASEAAGPSPFAAVHSATGSDPSDQVPPIALRNVGVSVAPRSAEERDIELSRLYEIDTLPGSPAIQVTAYKHPDVQSERAFVIAPDGYKVRYDYYPKAKFFEESLDTPADCLIVDLAQHFLSLASVSPRERPVSMIAYELRKKYFPETMTDVSYAADSAEAILNSLRSHYDENLPSAVPIDPAVLSYEVREGIAAKAYHSESLNSDQCLDAIRDGAFARFTDGRALLVIIQTWPAIAMDGKFFSLPYESVTAELRSAGLAGLMHALNDLMWLSEDATGAVSKDSAWRLRLARALASLRMIQSWQA
jgi:Histidine kinase-, DNA gyrase B-, and HSP90-like ATPase